MRQILFRGKTVKTGEWIEGCLSYFIDADFHSFIEDRVTLERIEVIPESVGQFVGMFDKYGKKIYEGDVILVEDHPYKGKYIVKYIGTGFKAVNTDKTATIQEFYVINIWESEVIGRSYDILTEEED